MILINNQNTNMITEKSLRTFIESIGHKPACPSIDTPRILYEYNRGKHEFDFYVNPHNLCWYADKEWKRYNPSLKTFKVHIREIYLK